MLLNIMIQDLLGCVTEHHDTGLTEVLCATEHHDTGLIEVAMILNIMIQDLLR